MNTTAEQINELINSDKSYYTEILEIAKRECREVVDNFHDQADWISGWAHAFVCPNCAGEMVFDYKLDYKPGLEYTCSNCRKKSKGKEFDGGWIYHYRSFLVSRLESVAVCALLGDEEAKNVLENFFDFYTDNYEQFGTHISGHGKIMPQLLDDAVWCIKAIFALYPCKALFSKEKLDRWRDEFFVPFVKSIDDPEHNWGIHNHILWHKVAVGAVAVCFDLEDLLKTCINEETGIRDQMGRGFSKDGFLKEDSVGYHYYALEAFTSFYQLYAEKHNDKSLLKVLKQAYTLPIELSYDGWNLPAINDGWYPINLGNYASQIYRAAYASDLTELKACVSLIEEKNPELLKKSYRLLMDCPNGKNAPNAETADLPDISVWENSMISVIRNPFYMFMRSGVFNDIHRHKDCLNIAFSEFSEDIGTPGYGHEMYTKYYAMGVSHNTFVIDGFQSEGTVPKTHIEAYKNGVRGVIDSDFNHLKTASRTLIPDGEYILDSMEVVLEDTHNIDWIFHSAGEMELSVQPTETAKIGECGGYEYFSNVKRLPATDSLTLTFKLGDKKLEMVCEDTSEFEIFTAKTPSNPANVLRNSVILRKNGNKADFKVRWCIRNA